MPPRVRRADIAALVQRMPGGSAKEQAAAALALTEAIHADPARWEAVLAAVMAAGGMPALLQMIGSSQGEHPGAALACGLLASLASGSAERCQAIMSADGIPPLARCLESSQSPTQTAAAGALAGIADPSGGGEAGSAAVVEAAALPAAIRRLSSSNEEMVLHATAGLLHNLATSPEQRPAISAADGIPPLVRLLQHPTPAVVKQAAAAISHLVEASARACGRSKRRAGSPRSWACSPPAATLGLFTR